MATQTPAEQDADHDRILFPREWVSPEQEVQEAGIIRIEDLFGRAPTTIDALYSVSPRRNASLAYSNNHDTDIAWDHMDHIPTSRTTDPRQPRGSIWRALSARFWRGGHGLIRHDCY
ncbi:hypothetical protein DYB36_013554 [Aphanomyces astaci]|uniref:Uncharacterized protein n=1 Tax=Aphanomyces astaci TaxID=112090 RepID=A0A397A1U8_APHAT|nr:hypothetical protein DYB36_013554 [Aphanomyces astaci]